MEWIFFFYQIFGQEIRNPIKNWTKKSETDRSGTYQMILIINQTKDYLTTKVVSVDLYLIVYYYFWWY